MSCENGCFSNNCTTAYLSKKEKKNQYYKNYLYNSVDNMDATVIRILYKTLSKLLYAYTRCFSTLSLGVENNCQVLHGVY